MVFQRRGQRERGFTLPELMLGMVISAMTLTALATLALAVAGDWERREPKAWQDPKQRPTRFAAAQNAAIVREFVKRCRYVTWAGSKPDGTGTAAILWTDDNTLPGKMNLCEVALLEYDQGARTVALYQVARTASNATKEVKYGDVKAGSDIGWLKSQDNVVASGRVMLREVSRFDVALRYADDAAGRPSLEYVLEIREGDRTRCEYQTAALRAPSVRPP